MFPSYCGAMGFVGWLLMLLLWAGLVFLAVCGIARLFPYNRRGTGPALPPPAAPGEDTRTGGHDSAGGAHGQDARPQEHKTPSGA